MREIQSVEEIQKIALDILLYIDDVCKKNDLHYFISDGTLLGAVRHKGFIPWDDDIDIWLPRVECEKFTQAINQSDSYYKVVSPKNTKDYGFGYLKVIDTRTVLIENFNSKCPLGIFVDVFPYDGLPGNEPEDYLAFVRRCIFLNQQHHRAYCDFSRFRTERKLENARRFIMHVMRKCITGKNILRYLEWYMKKHVNNEKPSFVGCLNAGYKEEAMMPAWICASTVDIEFEGHLFQAPIGYETFLKIEYGDYRKLPPVEMQVSNHDFRAWWKAASKECR